MKEITNNSNFLLYRISSSSRYIIITPKAGNTIRKILILLYMKIVSNFLRLLSKNVYNLSKSLHFIKKFGIYILLAINLLIFGKYHNIFVFNAEIYNATGNAVNIFPSNILASILTRTITFINWIFGFMLLPVVPSLFKLFNKGKYGKFIATILLVISCDTLLSLIDKTGAIGSLCAYFIPITFLIPASICIFALSNVILFKKEKTAPRAKKIREISQIKENLPSLNLLTIGEKIAISTNTEAQKKTLMQTLKDFGIDAKIIEVVVGPVVTLYSVELAAGIKSARLINLDDDIARSMQTFSTRIATIPGKNLIGIEIANQKRQTVYFKEGLQSDKYKYFEGNLPLYLGSNIYGDHEVFDLSTMPHLLVAGTTGSGKSVGIHTMLLSMLYKRLPSELKMILIDPKKLELTPYEDIPHLLLPVVTEAKQAVSSLKWVVREMEERYRNMSKLGVRNILTYNAKVEQNSTQEEKLPFIVVVVDEMADLMLVAGKEIEICIQRLAQMGRAAGIHIITATQRPSVDVITGTIKANFPTRISFKLASKIDSRTILGDMSGAEQLLGAGDMLYLATNGKLNRIHGSFVSESDVMAVVEFWKSQGKPQYIEIQSETESESMGNFDSFNEPYYQQAVELIRSTKKVSTSFLQRNYPIGYNRAAKIIERMEKEGIITRGDKFGRNRDIL